MSEFELPLGGGGCKKCEVPKSEGRKGGASLLGGIEPSALVGLLPLLGKSDPMLEAVVPMLQSNFKGDKLDLQSLLPLLPLLINKTKRADAQTSKAASAANAMSEDKRRLEVLGKASVNRLVTVDDYRRVG